MKTGLSIEGMSCAHCVKHVKDALEEIKGVQAAVVSLEGKSAEVEHDSSVTISAMKDALADAGYDVV